MGQKITVKKKKYWRKKSGTKTLPKTEQKSIWQKIKELLFG